MGRVDLIARHQDVPQRLRLGDELRGQGLVVEAAQPVWYGDRGGLGVCGEVGQLGVPVRGQRHHRDDPGAQARQGQDHELPAVRQLDDDPVAGPQAQPGQPGRGGAGAAEQLRVGQPQLAVDQRDLVRSAVGGLVQQRVQRAALPVSGGDVALDELLWPGDGALSDRRSHLDPPVQR